MSESALSILCSLRAGWGVASAPTSFWTPRWTPVGLRESCGRWCVGQGPSQKAHTQLGFAEVYLLTLMWWCCLACRPQSHPTARQYFITASLEEFGITAGPAEENPPCKMLSFKAVTSQGSPGWPIYSELNWSQQNIWRGRMRTGQLGKQMFFFLIMLWTLTNGSPWSFLIK